MNEHRAGAVEPPPDVGRGTGGGCPSLGQGGGGVVVNIQAGGLGKTLIGISFCVLPNSLLGNENKNFVFCFAFRSPCTIFAPKLTTSK